MRVEEGGWVVRPCEWDVDWGRGDCLGQQSEKGGGAEKDIAQADVCGWGELVDWGYSYLCKDTCMLV